MFSYVEKDRERLRQFLPWVDSTKTVQDEIDYIKMTHEKWDKFELFDFGIFSRDTNTYMGNVGVHTIAWAHERCELGYRLEGVLSQDSIEGGRYRDTLIFGKTKSSGAHDHSSVSTRKGEISKPLAPPYFAVIFSSELNTRHSDYEDMAEKMLDLATKQDGFLGAESTRGINLKGITVSYWSSLEAIKKWKEHPEHLEIQRRGKSEWYHSYSIKIAKVER